MTLEIKMVEGSVKPIYPVKGLFEGRVKAQVNREDPKDLVFVVGFNHPYDTKSEKFLPMIDPRTNKSMDYNQKYPPFTSPVTKVEVRTPVNGNGNIKDTDIVDYIIDYFKGIFLRDYEGWVRKTE